MVNATQTVLNRIAEHIQDNELLYLTLGVDKQPINLSTDDILSPVNIGAGYRNKVDTGSGVRTNNFFKKEYKIVATEPELQPVEIQSLGIATGTGTVNVEVDYCNATTGWSGSGADTIATGTGDYALEGAYSLKMGKSGTTVTNFGYYKNVTSRNATGKLIGFGFRSPDESVLDSTTALRIKYGSGTGDYYYKTYSRDTITNNKNRNDWFITNVEVGSGPMIAVGSPTITAMDYFEITAYTNATSDTVTLGDFNFDDIKLINNESESLLFGKIHSVPVTKTNQSEFYIKVTGSVTEKK